MRAFPFAVLRSAAVLGLAAMLATGCSNSTPRPKTVPVTGKVTYKGQPVAGANIAFLAAGPDMPSAMGKTDSQGGFQLTTIDPGDGAAPGSYQVTVTKIVTSSKSAAPVSGTGAASMEAAAKRGAAMQGPGDEAGGSGSLLPEKYAQASTSNLNYTVEEGKKNDFAIELTD